MDRRSLVTSGVAVAGALASAGISSLAAAAAPTGWAKVVESTGKCLTAGNACAAHCEQEMAKGEKMMAECHAAVMDMLAACEALQKMAARNSKHAAAMAKTCAQVCADCAKVCEKHGAHSDACKHCMDACKECETSCSAAA